MSHSIIIESDDPKGTVYTIEALARLLARLDPEAIAEESEIVGEIFAAIAEAAGTVASSFKYPGSESDQPAPSAFDLTDTRTPTAGWNLVQ